LSLLVQEGLVGDPLHRVVFDTTLPTASRLSACRRTARAVAGLHALQVPTPRVVTRADDVADLWGYVPAVGAADRGLAARLAEAIERAGANAGTHARSAQLAPSHGSLRTDHVLLCKDGTALVDLDGWCAAEPARDIGSLFAYLRWRAIRQPEHGELMAQVRQVVVAEYRQAGGPLDDADVAFFEAVSLLRIAGRRYRSLTVGEWPVVPALVDAATDLFSCGDRA
jgi:aminoglycoside phosphotransferase (APT) family kinase protein